MPNWISSLMHGNISPFHHASSSADPASHAGKPGISAKVNSASRNQIDQIEGKMAQITDLKQQLSLLMTKRSLHSPDRMIQMLSSQAHELHTKTHYQTENIDTILKQMKKGKLDTHKAGPHHELEQKLDILLHDWESLKDEYKSYSGSNHPAAPSQTQPGQLSPLRHFFE
ncbi:hypothetical protein [Vibrio mangrovi]|uniref:Uncharacterized protein n=1 Tax=Vibrio mangrovi TaxID=474394 RepID=A0A1Y6IT97_9VIBR|nr:hypothetical protein [Vibrio mangrovi]MDW6004586.1 hypothetical protein [Vibrio mangrovi]SMS00875.1 hypothetical protein VIM7927_02146 [Vibrio mangrovi]